MPLILPDRPRLIGGLAAPKLVHTGVQLHRVADLAVQSDALSDIRRLVEGNDWHAAIAFSDGRILLRPARRGMVELPADVQDKLIEVAIISNRDLHHDGHWLWAAGDGYLTAIFRDRDGDAWFENTFSDTWARLRKMDRFEWVEILERCWAEARERFMSLALKDAHLTSGSKARSPLLH